MTLDKTIRLKLYPSRIATTYLVANEFIHGRRKVEQFITSTIIRAFVAKLHLIQPESSLFSLLHD